MVHNFPGISIDTEALTGYTKSKFCETFKKANKRLYPKTVADVWEVIKKDIPKQEKKKVAQ